MFRFLPLINTLVTIGVSFLLLSISAIISSNTLNFVFLIWILFFNIFINIIYIIPAINKYIFSIFRWWLIGLSNAFVFQDRELPIISILCDQEFAASVDRILSCGTPNIRWTAFYEITFFHLPVRPSLNFVKIRSLIFSDILHDDSWPW